MLKKEFIQKYNEQNKWDNLKMLIELRNKMKRHPNGWGLLQMKKLTDTENKGENVWGLLPHAFINQLRYIGKTFPKNGHKIKI